MLYIIALILFIGWLFGYFVLAMSSLIHVLLVLALVAAVLKLVQGRTLV